MKNLQTMESQTPKQAYNADSAQKSRTQNSATQARNADSTKRLRNANFARQSHSAGSASPLKMLFVNPAIPQNKLVSFFLGALCALFLSAFIYLEHFLGEFNTPILPTLCAICGIFLYFKLSRFGAFVCGAFIGILWFYWVGFSFRFYDLSFLIPLVWIVFALVFGGLFVLFCLFQNPIYRIISLTLSSFIHPFGFNWFIIESSLTQSYFFPSKFVFFLLLIGVLIFSLMLTKRLYKTSAIWLVLFSSLLALSPYINAPKAAKSELKIKTTSLEIPQDLRWDSTHLEQIIQQNFEQIIKAEEEGYDLVILPETAFPLQLNLYPKLIASLKEASKDIAILTGGTYQEDERFFNSAYLFQNGEMQVFHKLILVPFGEKIPLPKPLVKWVNQVFFKNSSDFDALEFKTPNFAVINGERFQIAICYEATREEFYQNFPKNLIAISNNAWFKPSIEATLQKILMLYFAKNYGTQIFHASNASPSFTLTP